MKSICPIGYITVCARHAVMGNANDDGHLLNVQNALPRSIYFFALLKLMWSRLCFYAFPHKTSLFAMNNTKSFPACRIATQCDTQTHTIILHQMKVIPFKCEKFLSFFFLLFRRENRRKSEKPKRPSNSDEAKMKLNSHFAFSMPKKRDDSDTVR